MNRASAEKQVATAGQGRLFFSCYIFRLLALDGTPSQGVTNCIGEAVVLFSKIHPNKRIKCPIA